MIHYEQNGNYFILLGINYNLIVYTMTELQKQALSIYGIDIRSLLN